jgi:nicotinate-nucleotide pyrophosphorylase
MNLKTLRKTVKLCRRAGVKTEASGGVNLQNVRAIAKAGVDYISVGALTHSAPALDVSLKIV